MKDLEDRVWELLFAVRRSRRYHEHRQAFFEFWFRFSMAQVHSDLRRRFILLEQKIVQEPTMELIREWEAERLQIELDEPPIKQVLNGICHNEIMRAEGCEQSPVKISFCQRLVAQYFDLWPHTIK